MAEEELELDVNQSKGSKTTTILLIVLILLVLIMGGVGAWLFLGSDDAAGDSSASSGKEEKVLGPLQYSTMVPEFVVNFGPGSKVRYLQVDLQIATRDEAALQTVSTYRPVLRNDILVILSSVSFEDLRERSGKEALQKKLLNTINKVVTTAGAAASAGERKETKGEEQAADSKNNLTDTGGDVKGPIENVYFTSFIMQ